MIVHFIPGVRRAASQGIVGESFATGRLLPDADRGAVDEPITGSAVRPARL